MEIFLAHSVSCYQFYFDFQNMASSPKILKQLTEWAKNISIDADAYKEKYLLKVEAAISPKKS